MENIIIKNCNCINEGQIIIEQNKLNIKYGLNGTGKSTIGKAIYFDSNLKTNLDTLKPYNSDKIPNVENNLFQKVKIF